MIYTTIRVILTLIFVMKTDVSITLSLLNEEPIKEYRTNQTNFGLTDFDNLECFIKYVKTQSNHIDSDKGRRDVYLVMQTLFNRMRYDGIDWPTYYNTPRINCSQSIKRMKSGHLRPSFSINDTHDQIMISMAYSALYGFVEGDLKLDSAVLYFHSFGPRYDRAPHSQRNFHTEARHRFYCK